nr:MAG TPA: hypothetical protein [Caudoviricetes sp.]
MISPCSKSLFKASTEFPKSTSAPILRSFEFS